MPVRTRFGWKPDLPDHRDLMYQAPRAVLAALPTRYDVVANCPTEIFDQGQLGSCTANAIATVFQFDLIKQKAAQIVPSRLFIYFNEREKEGTVAFDSGA